MKYLGHIITDDGKDDKDILNACGQLYAQGNSLLRKFNMCTDNTIVAHAVVVRILCPQKNSSQINLLKV